LVDEIQDHLREQIYAGRYPPGTRLLQEQIADELDVSRTPLREALRMLELEGLVVRESNGRFRISPLSIEQIEDLTVMRINLEAVAVRLTVPQLGNADHAELEGRLAQIERYAKLEDWGGIEVPHREFHRALIAGAGDQITALLGQLWNHATRYRKVRFQQVADHQIRWDTARVEHRAIADAVEAYDAVAAAGWAVTQIARSAVGVAAHIDPDHPVPRVHAALQRHAAALPV
jgi:GntR family transcriptional regulator, rspAB operon transcriptional repressor